MFNVRNLCSCGLAFLLLLTTAAAQSTSTGSNSQTAGTVVEQGEVLRVGNNPNELGTRSLTLNGGTLEVTTAGNYIPVAFRAESGQGLIVGDNGGSLVITNEEGNLQLTGLLGGTGPLRVFGPGRFTPSNVSNSFAGELTLREGASIVLATASEGSRARLGKVPVVRVDNGAIHFSGSAGGAENTHERELIIEQGGATLALGMAPRQNPTITWAGPISGTGDLLINNAGGNQGTLVLAGENTHSGNIRVAARSTLRLDDEGRLRFVLRDKGESNRIHVLGLLRVNGAFIFDFDALTEAKKDDSWTLIEGSANTVYGPNFNVVGFEHDGNGVWTARNGHYRFDQRTGTLVVIPEPAIYGAMVGFLLLGGLGIRLRQMRRRSQIPPCTRAASLQAVE